MVCSVYEPSVAANVFHSRWAAYIDSVNAIPFTPRGRLVGGQQVPDLALERDGERVFLDRRLVAAMGRWTWGEVGRLAQRRGARTGDPHGLGGHAIGLIEAQDVAAGEAPGAIDDDADAEPLALVRGDALDATGLDRDRFIEAANDPRVGVSGAEGRGGIECALGEVSHQDRPA